MPEETPEQQTIAGVVIVIILSLIAIGVVGWTLMGRGQTIAVRPTQSETPAPEPLTGEIYLVRLEDNGSSGELIGCGDSLISVSVDFPVDLENTLEARVGFVIGELLERSKPAIEPNYSALAQTNLTVDSAQETPDGSIEVRLSGDYTLAGVCDNPRFEEQLTQTIASVTGSTELTVFINNTELSELLSEK